MDYLDAAAMNLMLCFYALGDVERVKVAILDIVGREGNHGGKEEREFLINMSLFLSPTSPMQLRSPSQRSNDTKS